MIVLTGGKFNCIHAGHVWMLREARKLGSCLVVVIAHDSHNTRTYAKPAEERKRDIEALEIADEVVIGKEKDFFLVVENCRPDIIVLGYDQELPFEKNKLDRLDKKIKIIKLPKHGDYSSRKVVS